MIFATSMEAKEFLVSRIAEEASRKHAGLSELERKMLYFSEQFDTLPDMMEVNEQFEAAYDSENYEKKIKRLSKRAFQHDRKDFPENVERWHEAIKVLKKEDHYILVMLDVPRSPGDIAKLFVAGIVVAALGIIAAFGYRWVVRTTLFRIPDNIKIFAYIGVVAVVTFLSYSKQGDELGKWFSGLFERVGKWF